MWTISVLSRACQGTWEDVHLRYGYSLPRPQKDRNPGVNLASAFKQSRNAVFPRILSLYSCTALNPILDFETFRLLAIFITHCFVPESGHVTKLLWPIASSKQWIGGQGTCWDADLQQGSPLVLLAAPQPWGLSCPPNQTQLVKGPCSCTWGMGSWSQNKGVG